MKLRLRNAETTYGKGKNERLATSMHPKHAQPQKHQLVQLAKLKIRLVRKYDERGMHVACHRTAASHRCACLGVTYNTNVKDLTGNESADKLLKFRLYACSQMRSSVFGLLARVKDPGIEQVLGVQCCLDALLHANVCPSVLLNEVTHFADANAMLSRSCSSDGNSPSDQPVLETKHNRLLLWCAERYHAVEIAIGNVGTDNANNVL